MPFAKLVERFDSVNFLVGWYNLNFESADLRRLRSDARTGRVLVVPQKRIQDGQMFGVRNLSRRTFGQATSSSNVKSPSSATCKN